MSALSYSRIRLYNECPKQFWFRQQNTPQLSLPAVMTRGKYAHVFYEEYVRRCMAENSMQLLGEVDGIGGAAYARASLECGKDKEPLLLPHEWMDVFETVCRPWAERTAIPVENVCEVEMKWAINDKGERVDFSAEDAIMRGVIDRLDLYEDIPTLVDYKSGYGGKADPLQADIYAWALLHDYERVQVIFEFTARDWRTIHTYSRADDFKRLDTEIRAIMEVINTITEFVPRPSIACIDCPFAYCCDEKAQVQEAVVTEEDARLAVETISLLERDLKSVKAALRRWCDVYGAVSHNGTIWQVWEQDGEGFHDAQEFYAACIDAEIDPWVYLSVNNTRSRKLRKKFPTLVTKNPSLVFRGKKDTDA